MTTTCPEHRWTLPCLTCTFQVANDRINRLWTLGFTGTQVPSQKRIELRSKRSGIVAVRSPGGFVKRVDPHTREATTDVQQFELAEDGRLRILPQSEHVDNPDVVDVSEVKLR